MVPTSLVENGRSISLELVVYRPAGPGPFPAVVFNHGSTGTGSDPSEFTKTWHNAGIADFFRDRGWIVFFPQRRGRGKSEGLYDEGFTPNRSGYTCDPSRSLAGLERAMTDIDAIMTHIRARADVRPERMIIGGQSRGGILSITYAGTRAGTFLGVINFVGGWMSDQCPNPTAINTVSFVRGAAFTGPTLWLYGLSDPYYSLAHSEANYTAFLHAGGHGDFQTFNLGANNGHLVFLSPALWSPSAEQLLAALPPEPEPDPEPETLPDLTIAAAEHLLNLSIRAQSGPSPVIVGFVIPGDRPRSVILRGIGPALSHYGVTHAASSPSLNLFSSTGDHLATIGRWIDTPGLGDAFQAVGAFALDESDPDTATRLDLAPGAYSMHLNDASASGLILLGELFAVTGTDDAEGLANLSARVSTGFGDATAITGFVVGGTKPRRVLIRAVGPALTGYGVTDAVANPALTVYDRHGLPIATNDNWGDTPDALSLADTARAVGAFPLAETSLDAAVLLELAPGPYTVHVTAGTSGTALIETYAVP